MINFDSNNFSLLSEGVSLVMQESIKKTEECRIPSYGLDQFIKAEIEKARYQIAGLLNASSQMLFFNGSAQSSDIAFVLSLATILDIKLIITSKSEEKNKIDFLKQLSETGKFKLKLINTNDSIKFDTNRLREIINSDNQRKLITLSHANRISGELLPVKEVVSICHSGNDFFHLNTNLTIGKYQIDFEKLSPNFMSFGCNLLGGPVSIGGIIMNPTSKIDREDFNLIYRYLQISESKNLPLISGFEKALSLAYSNINNYQKKIYLLNDYFIFRLKQIPDIKILNLENDKKGLINIIPISVNSLNFGIYLKEKLQLKGIAVELIKDSLENKDQLAHFIIPIALNADIKESEIDYFIECLDQMRKD
jgi:cysteine desulfurase